MALLMDTRNSDWKDNRFGCYVATSSVTAIVTTHGNVSTNTNDDVFTTG